MHWRRHQPFSRKVRNDEGITTWFNVFRLSLPGPLLLIFNWFIILFAFNLHCFVSVLPLSEKSTEHKQNNWKLLLLTTYLNSLLALPLRRLRASKPSICRHKWGPEQVTPCGLSVDFYEIGFIWTKLSWSGNEIAMEHPAGKGRTV